MYNLLGTSLPVEVNIHQAIIIKIADPYSAAIIDIFQVENIYRIIFTDRV